VHDSSRCPSSARPITSTSRCPRQAPPTTGEPTFLERFGALCSGATHHPCGRQRRVYPTSSASRSAVVVTQLVGCSPSWPPTDYARSARLWPRLDRPRRSVARGASTFVRHCACRLLRCSPLFVCWLLVATHPSPASCDHISLHGRRRGNTRGRTPRRAWGVCDAISSTRVLVLAQPELRCWGAVHLTVSTKRVIHTREALRRCPALWRGGGQRRRSAVRIQLERSAGQR